MALIKCEECGKDFSDTVKKCPNCGFVRPVKKEAPKGCAIVLFSLLGIFIVVLAIDTINPKSPPPISAEEQKRIDKHGECPASSTFKATVEQILKNGAKDPESVRIYKMSEIFYNEKDGWICEFDWGARNSFGGMVRSSDWFVAHKGVIRKANGTYK